MTILTRTGLRAALVALVISSWWTSANAQSSLTPAGTSIQNRATVNYSVGGQPQTVIESSPTGNTTPGANAGASTTFVVDNRVDLTVAELSGSATITAPGATNAALAFTVTNTGNAPQGYRLTLTRGSRDLAVRQHRQRRHRLGNLSVRVDEDPSAGQGTGNDTFDGTETATAIEVLNPGYSVTVFVVVADGAADARQRQLRQRQPASANRGHQHQRRHARRRRPRASTTRRRSRSCSPTPATTRRKPRRINSRSNRRRSPSRRRRPSSTTASAARARVPFRTPWSSTRSRSRTAAPRRRPSGLAISDPIPATTTFQTGLYAGPSDVAITGGAAATCIAETPADTNTDGCFRNGGGNLVVGGAALGSIAAGAIGDGAVPRPDQLIAI